MTKRDVCGKPLTSTLPPLGSLNETRALKVQLILRWIIDGVDLVVVCSAKGEDIRVTGERWCEGCSNYWCGKWLGCAGSPL